MPLVLSSLSEKGESEKERKEALKSVDDAAFTLVSASFLLGFSHAAGGKEAEGKKALADDDISFHADSSFHEVPFREAVEFLKSRVPTLKPEWKKIERELQFRAFTMALLTREDLLEKARKHLTAVAEAGGGVKEFWSGARKSDWAEGLVAGYFETVFRTNVQTAYCAGRLMQYKNAKNEAYELLFMDDERTSDTCRSLQSKCAGRAIAKADRFWEVVGYPPYHYNCRTTLRAVYPEEKPERVSFTESELSHYREDVGDFGGDPIASGSFWKLTRGMLERITKYGLEKEAESFAKKCGVEEFSLTTKRLDNTQENAVNYKSANDEKIAEFQRQSDAVYKEFTDKERQALSEYTQGGYLFINGDLGIGEKSIYEEGLNKAIGKFKLNDDIITYRGTNEKYYKGCKVGDVIVGRVFYSTSVNYEQAKIFADDVTKYDEDGNKGILLEIKVPKNANALYIGGNTDYKPEGYTVNEYEMLLSNKTKYKVKKIETGKMTLEVIKNE